MFRHGTRSGGPAPASASASPVSGPGSAPAASGLDEEPPPAHNLTHTASPSISTHSDDISALHPSASHDLHLAEKGFIAPDPPINPLNLTPSHTTATSIPPQDTGWAAWSMCICAHIVIANTWGIVNSFGIFQAYYADFLHPLPPSAISWIGSLQIFLGFFLSSLTGAIADAGYFRLTFFIGTAFQAAGMLGASFAREGVQGYWQLVLGQGVCIGCAAGFLCCPVMAVTSTYFSKRRGLAMGIVTCGNVTGGMVYPAMARQLLPSVGFGWTMRAMGVMQAGMLLACGMVVRTRVRAVKGRGWGGMVDWASFREVHYTVYCVACFFNFCGTFIAYYYISSFSRTSITPALSLPASFNLLLVINGIGALGRLGSAHLADRIGPLNLLLPSTLLSSLCCFTWIAVSTPDATYAWSAVYGIIGGAYQAMFPAALVSLTPDLSKAGLRMGMAFTVTGFSVLAGPPVAGAIITSMGGKYLGAQLYAGLFLLVGSGCVVVVQWAIRRAKTTEADVSWWKVKV